MSEDSRAYDKAVEEAFQAEVAAINREVAEEEADADADAAVAWLQSIAEANQPK